MLAMFVLRVVKAFFRKPYIKRVDKPTKRERGNIAKHQGKLVRFDQKSSGSQGA
jgi:hypothetical protein